MHMPDHCTYARATTPSEPSVLPALEQTQAWGGGWQCLPTVHVRGPVALCAQMQARYLSAGTDIGVESVACPFLPDPITLPSIVACAPLAFSKHTTSIEPSPLGDGTVGQSQPPCRLLAAAAAAVPLAAASCRRCWWQWRPFSTSSLSCAAASATAVAGSVSGASDSTSHSSMSSRVTLSWLSEETVDAVDAETGECDCDSDCECDGDDGMPFDGSRSLLLAAVLAACCSCDVLAAVAVTVAAVAAVLVEAALAGMVRYALSSENQLRTIPVSQAQKRNKQHTNVSRFEGTTLQMKPQP